MHTLRLTFIFLIGMAVTALLLAVGTPRWLVYSAVILFYISAMVLPNIYITYYSNSLKRIGRYVERNRRKAIYGFPYALAHGNGQDIEKAIERILLVHKQPIVQSAYKTLLAIYRGQPGIAAQYAEMIEREPLRSYYLAHAAAASGDLERAAALNDKIDEAWMNHSILALIAFEQNSEDFEKHAADSVEAARGVQKFTLRESFRRMKRENSQSSLEI